MNPGYLFWGTADGFNSNLLGNRTEAPIDLRAFDDKIRQVRVKNSNAITEVYYVIFEHGPYLFASAVDPTAKDTIGEGRQGFLVCSIYFDKKYSLKGGVLEVLNFLLKSFKEKKAAHQILTHSECEAKVAYLSLEDSQVNRVSSMKPTIISKCTSTAELNLALANKMLGFTPALAYLFLSDVEGVKILPADCNQVSWDVISLQHKQLAAKAGSDLDKQKEFVAAAHNQFKQLLAAGESGNAEQAGEKLFRLVPTNKVYSELLNNPEYAKLNSWYTAARAKNQLQNDEIERAHSEELYKKALWKFKNGDLEAARITLNSITSDAFRRNREFQKLREDISKEEKKKETSKKIITIAGIVLLVGLLGGGGFYFYNATGESQNAGGNIVAAEDPFKKLSDEWLKKKSIEIQSLFKIAGISGYDSLKGNLTWSEGAECFLIVTNENTKKHLPFEVIEKLSTCENKQKIEGIVGHTFNNVISCVQQKKKLMYIGVNKSYLLRTDDESRSIEFVVLNETYEPVGEAVVLTTMNNQNLFNSKDVQYLYKKLDYTPINALPPESNNPVPPPPPLPKAGGGHDKQ